MSIAEKLTTIAENMPKVFQAGFDAAIPTFEESGEIVRCFPRSDYPLAVSAEGSAQITRCGKNIFDKNNYTPINIYPSSSTAFNKINDRSVLVSIKPNTTYTVTCNEPTTIRLATSVEYPVSGGAISVYKYRSGSKIEPLTITTGSNDKWMLIQLVINADVENGYTLAKCVESLQVEVSNIATSYEPYNGESFNLTNSNQLEITALEGVNTIYTDIGTITVRGKVSVEGLLNYINNAIAATTD